MSNVKNFFKSLVGIENDIDNEVNSINNTHSKKQSKGSNIKKYQTKYEPIRTNYKTTLNDKDTRIIKMQDNSEAIKVHIFEPISFKDDVEVIANTLITAKSVIINLSKVDEEDARKIFDFMNGVVYAIDGNIAKVTSKTYIFCPKGVEIENLVDGARKETNN